MKFYVSQLQFGTLLLALFLGLTISLGAMELPVAQGVDDSFGVAFNEAFALYCGEWRNDLQTLREFIDRNNLHDVADHYYAELYAELLAIEENFINIFQSNVVNFDQARNALWERMAVFDARFNDVWDEVQKELDARCPAVSEESPVVVTCEDDENGNGLTVAALKIKERRRECFERRTAKRGKLKVLWTRKRER
jgi:hypothetical protein